jgi:hypothetical protein
MMLLLIFSPVNDTLVIVSSNGLSWLSFIMIIIYTHTHVLLVSEKTASVLIKLLFFFTEMASAPEFSVRCLISKRLHYFDKAKQYLPSTRVSKKNLILVNSYLNET